MFAFPVLLGDIGGTNARFALLDRPDGTVELLPRALTAATPSPVGAIAVALQSSAGAKPRSAIIAVATRPPWRGERSHAADYTRRTCAQCEAGPLS